jgi:hypothetical protein
MEFFSLFEVTPWKYSWTIPHLATSTYLRSICSVPNRWYLILKACTASWTFYIDWFSQCSPKRYPWLGFSQEIPTWFSRFCVCRRYSENITTGERRTPKNNDVVMWNNYQHQWADATRVPRPPLICRADLWGVFFNLCVASVSYTGGLSWCVLYCWFILWQCSPVFALIRIVSNASCPMLSYARCCHVD